jgi:hypothetical protein
MTGARVRLLLLMLLMLQATTTAAQGIGQQGRASLDLRTRLPGYGTAVYMDTVGTGVEVAAPVAKAYVALVSVLNDWGVPVTVADTTTWTVGNLQYRKTRSLAGTPLSRFFRCGYGLDGPNADNYQVTMAIVARLQPREPGFSTVRVGIAAGAKSITAGNADPVFCASEGKLEHRMIDAMKKKLEGA